MVQPINYQLNVQSPFEAALSGFKIGATIADVAAQRQAQEAGAGASSATADASAVL